MANIIDSYFISSQFHQFYTCTSFCSKTNILCASAVSPSQYQLRNYLQELLIAKGGQLTGKMGTILLIFFFLSLRQNLLSAAKPLCLFTNDSAYTLGRVQMLIDFLA